MMFCIIQVFHQIKTTTKKLIVVSYHPKLKAKYIKITSMHVQQLLDPRNCHWTLATVQHP